MGSHGLEWLQTGSSGFFNELKTVLPGFTEFYRVLLGFTGFYRAAAGSSEFETNLNGFKNGVQTS